MKKNPISGLSTKELDKMTYNERIQEALKALKTCVTHDPDDASYHAWRDVPRADWYYATEAQADDASYHAWRDVPLGAVFETADAFNVTIRDLFEILFREVVLR